MAPAEAKNHTPSIQVARWPTELPLTVLTALAAAGLWVLFVVTIFPAVYALILGIFFFVSHVAFIAYIRGSAVRLGPDQMPELHARVAALSRQLGLRQVPAAYVMQAGGSLNAFATRLFATNFIVLFSDLLDACKENTEARDFIVAHELGHLRAGHMRWMWFLMPGFLVPFLGSACSRAREYTSDRYGMAVARNREAALRGLAILAAGGANGPRVNLRALTRQREDLNFGWMTLGTWFAGHPPLAERIVALEPSLGDGQDHSSRGGLRALGLITAAVLIPTVAGVLVMQKFMPEFREAMAAAQAQAAASDPAGGTGGNAGAHAPRLPADPARVAQVHADLTRLQAVIEEHRARVGLPPAGSEDLLTLWSASQSGPFPMDPFDGAAYGYLANDTDYVIWSSGPDPQDGADDIELRSGGGAGE